jgi:hypothetical protein
LNQINIFKDKQVLANLTSNIISIAFLIIATALGNALNRMTPQEMNRHPYIIFVFFWVFCVPLIMSYATILIYYSQHKNLQASIKNEIKDFLQKTLNRSNSPMIELSHRI